MSYTILTAVLDSLSPKCITWTARFILSDGSNVVTSAVQLSEAAPQGHGSLFVDYTPEARAALSVVDVNDKVALLRVVTLDVQRAEAELEKSLLATTTDLLA